jgi:serine/threonine-protein kinase HipA
MGEVDFLLGVSDITRMGALRFSMEPEGPYLEVGDISSVPPLVKLPRLLAATERLLEDHETAEDLRILLAPGSSLGGARPKASVFGTDGKLMIAKFPKKDDEWDVVRWEAVTLDLARAAGIETAAYDLQEIAGRPVLILQRFDRGMQRNRIPFLSAMAMLNAQDMERRTYLDIADALTIHGADPDLDLRALWRRMVFGVLVSNVDDHLRNHGFLCAGGRGWRLSPAYDLNPEPRDINPGFLSTGIDDAEDRQASLERVLAVAEYFRIGADQAVGIVAEVNRACVRWRQIAHGRGIPAAGVERMETAFEHEESVLARRL